jgi:perosamine synthetase
VALAAMLHAAGVGPGHEVIVPSLTFIATATSVLHVGATPVFADVEPDTFTLSVDDVERRITARTRAIVPVHYGGQMAEMDRFRGLAEAHGLLLFEDAAQAHGASLHGRGAGSWSDAGMFSFTPMKLITTGEGAVVTTDSEELAYRMRLLRNHGMDRQYHHEILGWNWRITEMQAAMGVVQVGRLDHILAVKESNARDMADLLERIPGVRAPFAAPGRVHPYTLYTLTLGPDHRDALVEALGAAGIETRFYFPPVHRQPVFAGSPTTDADLPVTTELADRIVSVPFHAGITPADLEEIAGIVEQVVAG